VQACATSLAFISATSFAFVASTLCSTSTPPILKFTACTTLANTKIVLVTGASRGIGQAIALSLGGAGASVIGTATSDKGTHLLSCASKDYHG
jgi:NADPH:quinone reductase-like Zn-dependent oxidoreductase